MGYETHQQHRKSQGCEADTVVSVDFIPPVHRGMPVHVVGMRWRRANSEGSGCREQSQFDETCKFANLTKHSGCKEYAELVQMDGIAFSRAKMEQNRRIIALVFEPHCERPIPNKLS